MSWPTYPLDQLGSLSRGRSRHRPRDAAHLYGGPFPFVQTGDVKKAPLYLKEYSQTYSEAGLAQSKIWPAGTLCITIAANIAETAILDIEACFPDSIIGFNPDPEKTSAKFIKYQFDALLSGQMRTISQGAAQDNLSQAKLLTFEFNVPDLPIQERIVAILSAYDDLIENNRRRIALLEQAARLLYREWFVHFRFPGHETAKFVDGLPEGWSNTSISELADIFRGKSYKSTELRETAGQPFINLKCFDRGGGFRVSGLKWFVGDHKDHHFAKVGDIVIAVTDLTRDAAIVSQAARVPRAVGANALYSMDLVKAMPKEGTDPIWFYGLLRFSRFSIEVKEEATGATVLHLKPKHIEKWGFPLPPKSLRQEFEKEYAPILDQVDSLQVNNEKLTAARDLLLPRLMDGRIPV